ncbi:CHAT domain-containing protein [Rhizobium anhuiense]|uniref:CHAT domain-containing protein n=1 Tax=Rhizobium anhuiense TaxID=1184720 RepID=UPI001FE00BA2|nr:CHAT domain-containing protein [Rhizobium anhuiense]
MFAALLELVALFMHPAVLNAKQIRISGLSDLSLPGVYDDVAEIVATARSKSGKVVTAESTAFILGRAQQLVTSIDIIEKLGKIQKGSLHLTLVWQARRNEIKITLVRDSIETQLALFDVAQPNISYDAQMSTWMLERNKGKKPKLPSLDDARPNSLCPAFRQLSTQDNLIGARLNLVSSDRYNYLWVNTGEVTSITDRIITEMAGPLAAGLPVFNSLGQIVGVTSRATTSVEVIPIDKILSSFGLESDPQCAVQKFPAMPNETPRDHCTFDQTAEGENWLACGLVQTWEERQAQTSVDMNLDEQCQLDGLYHEYVRDEVWQSAAEVKRRTGLMPDRQEIEFDIQSRAASQRDGIFSALRNLSWNSPTYLLIYSHYYVSQRRTGVCVWLLEPDGRVTSQSTAANSFLLPSLWSGIKVTARTGYPRTRDREDCSEPPTSRSFDDNQAQAALSKVAEAVLPLEISKRLNEIGEGSRLLISPGGQIGKIPFSALPLGSGYIVDKFAVVMLTSLQSLLPYGETDVNSTSAQNSKTSPDVGQAMVVGNPDLTWDRKYCWRSLPYASEEATKVASLVGIAPLLEKHATYKAVTDRLLQGQKTLSLIYFATHGVTDPDNPADGSYLALSLDHFRGRDLRKMQFKMRPLVVLSACETGLGKVFEGEGIYGLVMQWYLAGANEIAASLWDVDDQGNAVLMQEFTSQVLHGGRQSAEFALQNAMQTVRHQFPDPAIWASMMVYGNPSVGSQLHSSSPD